ncbi:MerR family transcriptional regulator [Heliobacillus mobilis]|uniref:MerR family transcriptional regulator n=1 Tax=Heliobacterium mobile TaxID=28064 RepID=A0A6I3SGQ3_HELMO|nr:MerR family transcriptional regulator [Heliobacterium mobile]
MLFISKGVACLEKKKHLKIGELAKRCNVNRRTVDFYTSMGLVVSTERTDGNYRLYDESTVERIQWIKDMQEQKYSLDEIKEKLLLVDESGTEPFVSQQLDSVIHGVEALEREITTLLPLLNKIQQGANEALKEKLEYLFTHEQTIVQSLAMILERLGS